MVQLKALQHWGNSFAEYRFNSKMVQLKGESSEAERGAVNSFQFQNGTIKRIDETVSSSPVFAVSIPKWYN